MINSKLPENLEEMIGAAVSHYWDTRLSQQQKQQKSGKVDYGLRGAVTGGAQMDGFIELFTRIITSTGLNANFVQRKGSLELPGYFRPTKEWDLLVVKDGKLIAEALLICGQHTEKAHFIPVHNLFWDISSCSKIVSLHSDRFG